MVKFALTSSTGIKIPLATRPKIVIADEVHALLPERLAAQGWQVVYEPKLQPDQLWQHLDGSVGLVVNSKFYIGEAVLVNAPDLRFVARIGSGLEIFDREAAKQRNIAVISAPEGNCNAVAEQALGMLLMLLNHLRRADAQVRQGQWIREPNRGTELSNKTIGIIGFGHTGRRFAELLAGFGCKILAYDKYLSPDFARTLPQVQACAHEDEVLAQADVLSLHLPLTTETRSWLHAERLAQLQRGCLLINTARGACVPTELLVKALETGQLGGACLDVLENEQPDSYNPNEQALYERLHGLDSVVLTPHIAGWTHESKHRLAEVLFNKIMGLTIP
jgi:D-3-phosphoglycerate dehydrogenase / 2-oxoglutarate reductase